MRALKVFLLVLISVILVVCGWLYLAGMSAERTVLSTAYYRGLVDEVGLPSAIYEELQKTLAEIMLEGIAEEMTAEEMDEGMPEQLSIMMGALTRAFDVAWLEEQFLLVTDDILALVEGEQETLTAAIDLQEVKARFRDELIGELEALPDDKKEELDLPPEAIEMMVDKTLAELDIPDQLNLAELIAEDGLLLQHEGVLAPLQTFQEYFRFIPYLVFALLLLFSCLLAGIVGGLKWFGAASLFFSAGFFIGLQLLRTVFLPPLLASLNGEMPVGPELLRPVAAYTIARAATVPLLCAALGLALLMGGIIYGKVQWKAQV